MKKKYIQRGIIAGPVSSTVIFFSLFLMALAGLFAGYKYRSSPVIYTSITVLIAITIIARRLYNLSYVSLSISDTGLEYISYFWQYFRFIEKRVDVLWAEIEDILWLNKQGGLFKVTTQKGSFSFFFESERNNIDAFETIKKHVAKYK